MEPLKKGYRFNDITIGDVIGIGGNSIVYQGNKDHIGRVLVKEYLYQHHFYDVNRDVDDTYNANDEWKEINRDKAYEESTNLATIRNLKYNYADYQSEFIEYKDMYFSIIMNYSGTILSKYEIITIKELYDITSKVVNAVNKLHDLGYLHLDLSLDNILVRDTGDIHILDFSTMQRIGEIDTFKLVESSHGTASEIYKRINNPFDLDYDYDVNKLSDIYNIGCMMNILSDKIDIDNLEHTYYKSLYEKAKKFFQNERIEGNTLYDELYDTLEHMNYRNHQLVTTIHKLEQNRAYKNLRNMPIYYRNMKLYGREVEKDTLNQFKDLKNNFMYLSVSAVAGAGKSSLVYHYMNEQNDDWKYLFINDDGLNELISNTDDLFHLGYHIMIAIDYIPKANKKDISQFIKNLYNSSTILKENSYKVRVIIIERDYTEDLIPRWITNMNGYNTFKDSFFTNIKLQPLDLHTFYDVVCMIHTFTYDEYIQINHKLLQIDPIYQRPLYALLLALIAKEQGVDKLSSIHTNYDVLEEIINKEVERVNDIYNNDLLEYYVLATIHNQLDLDCLAQSFKPYELKDIISKMDVSNNKLQGLQPDILGEYLILYFLRDYMMLDTYKNEFMNKVWSYNSTQVYETLIHIIQDFYHDDLPDELMEQLKYFIKVPKSLLYDYNIRIHYYTFYSLLDKDSDIYPYVLSEYVKLYLGYIKQNGLSNVLDIVNEDSYSPGSRIRLYERISHLILNEVLAYIIFGNTCLTYLDDYSIDRNQYNLYAITPTQKYLLSRNLAGIYDDISLRDSKYHFGNQAIDIYDHYTLTLHKGSFVAEHLYLGVCASNRRWLEQILKKLEDKEFLKDFYDFAYSQQSKYNLYTSDRIFLSDVYSQKYDFETMIYVYFKGRVLSNIGGTYYANKEYEQALEWYKKSLVIREEYHLKDIGNTYSAIMSVCFQQKDYLKAFDYYKMFIRTYNNQHLLCEDIDPELYKEHEIFSKVVRALGSIVRIYTGDISNVTDELEQETNGIFKYCENAIKKRYIFNHEDIKSFYERQNLIKQAKKVV